MVKQQAPNTNIPHSLQTPHPKLIVIIVIFVDVSTIFLALVFKKCIHFPEQLSCW